MDSLKSLIKEYFKDTLYEAEVVMRSSRKKKLTIVTDNLRASVVLQFVLLSAQHNQFQKK